MNKEDVIYMDTMQYFLAMKKKEILPWVDLESIMLSEISRRKTNTVWYHLRIIWDWTLDTAELGSYQRVGELEDGGLRIQMCSLKTSSGDLVYSIVIIINNTILYNKKLLRD